MDYNKPTWQTHEKYSSAKAVDVLFETHSGGGDQCAMSYKWATDVTWMVDLEDIYSIYQVVIFHKTDGVRFGKYTDSSMTMFFFHMHHYHWFALWHIRKGKALDILSHSRIKVGMSTTVWNMTTIKLRLKYNTLIKFSIKLTL